MNCELMLTYDTPALRQTGSRNLTGKKTLPTIWGTYMKLVTKYQISAINSYWENCDETYLGRTEGRTDRWTEVKQYIPLPLWGAGYTYEIKILENCNFQGIKCVGYCFIVIFSFCCWPLKYTAVNKIWNIEIKNLENCNFQGIKMCQLYNS